MKKITKLNLLFSLVVLSLLLFTGCATTPVAYYFTDDPETASISFKKGNPEVSLVYFDDNAIPEAVEETHWNPIYFPAGREFQLTVHAYFHQSSGGSRSLLGAIVNSAISSNRSVDKDVTFTCPPLEAGKEYQIAFNKGAGIKGKNTLVLIDLSNRKIILRYEFES